MKKLLLPLILGAGVLLSPLTAFAASNSDVAHFTQDSLTIIASLAALACVFFLIRGGYIYITSTGKPEALIEAKRTIQRALIGLAIVLGATVISSLLNGAFTHPAGPAIGTSLDLSPLTPAKEDGSLAKILLDAIAGFLQNIIQTATKPILDGITSFLTNTPALATNSVVFNFWLIMTGIVDSLFALVIALLGFNVMSASTFGFEETSLKQLLPRIGLAFLLANTSIFLIDWIVQLCQVLVHAILNSTGGLGQAWILNAFSPGGLLSGGTVIITLIFVVVFVLLAVILLLFYITRLMILALGAVVSPFIFMIWLLPRWSDFAEGLMKSYVVMVFSLFVHVVIIQLASAFLTIPNQVGTNPLISILIGIAMLGLLLKSTGAMIQLALASQATGAFRKMGGQLMNVLSPAPASKVAAAKAGAK